jgi:hypothetical protein
MIKPILILSALALATPALANTPPYTPRSDARFAADQARNSAQANRIANGIDSGRLNQRESAYLTHRNIRTTAATNRLAADGFYSRKDAARIDYRQDTTSRRIVRGKTNYR